MLMHYVTSTHAVGFSVVLLPSKLFKSGCFQQLRVSLQDPDNIAQLH